MTNGISASRGVGLLLGAAAVGVLVLLFMPVEMSPRDDGPVPPGKVPVVTSSDDATSNIDNQAASAGASLSEGASVDPVTSTENPAPQPTPDIPATGPSLPRLDIVRIDARGATVVAGTGSADSDIVLRLDGRDVATARTDATGNFVALFDTTPSAMPRILTVEAKGADGVAVRAEESIIVAPSVSPATPVDRGSDVAEMTGPGGEPVTSNEVSGAVEADAPEQITTNVETTEPIQIVDGASENAVDVPAPEVATETAADDTPPATPATGPAPMPRIAAASEPDAPVDVPGSGDPATAAPRLFRSGPDGLTVVPAADTPPKVRETLGIDAITYDAEGEVQIAGRGARDSRLRIYLDNRPVTLTRVDGGGAWTTPLPDVKTGVYTLRVDALAEDGTVTSRIETPFERTAPAIAAAARRDGATAITVQPGFTLWAISEGYFGDGIRYVQIFEANRSQIRNPDLIFPGQVFSLPDAER